MNIDVLQRAKELSDAFRKTASENDANGEFPVKNFDLLKQENFLALVIPTNMGGFGADFSTYTEVVKIFASGDLSTALCFNMHNTSIGPIAEADPGKIKGRISGTIEEFRRSIFNEVTAHHKVYASASSEPGAGSNFAKYMTSYQRSANGYILNGTKSFVSMSTYADYFVVPAKPKGKELSNLLSLFIVSRTNPGVKILNTWNPVALKSTISNTVIFEDCMVDDNAIFMGIEGMAFYKILKDPHWIIGGFSAAYLGLCQSIFDFILNYIKEKKQYQPGVSNLLEGRVGELAAELEVVTQIVAFSASIVDQRTDERKMKYYVFLAKHLVNALVSKIAAEGIQLCGGSSLSKKYGLERFYREAACCSVMPATRDQCLLHFGREALGGDLNEKHHVWQ